MDIQTEVQKIHSQFGTTEMANYQIQKLFDKAIKEAVTEALRIHDVVVQSEQLVCDCGNSSMTWYGNDDDKKCFCFNCKKESN